MEIKKSVHEKARLVVAMVVAEMLLGVNIVLCKVAAVDGMPVSIIVAYRFIFSAAFLSPFALILERNKRPTLTWTILFQSFVAVLLGGTLFNNLFYESIVKTSATFVTALGNVIPAMTAVIAVLLRKEKISLHTVSGKAKVISIIICIGGAMLLTFYKGAELPTWSTHNHFSLVSQPAGESPATSHSGNYALGVILAILACLCYSTWIVLLSMVGKNYPCHYSSTSLMNLMGAVQSTVYALCTERDNWSGWKLDLKLLLIIFYSGFLASGVAVILFIWCGNKSGPLFVSIFNPLVLVFVALGSLLLLNESLYLGSVLGGIVIIVGVYGVLWAKGRDMKQAKPPTTQVSAVICDIEMAEK